MKNIKKQLITVCMVVLSFANGIAQGYKLPTYTTFKLPNGLTVNLMEQHDVPLISVSAIIPAGAIYDGEKAGLASLTANVLKNGTTSYTKTQIAEELDFIGATIETNTRKEFMTVFSNFANKDQQKVLNLVKEIILNPTFNASEFEKEKSRLLVRLEQQKESPRAVIGFYFDKFLYGNHVYGNIINGMKETVEPLTIQDVKKFYSENYIPNNAVLSLAGDFSSKDMKAALTSLFGSWKKGKDSKEDLTKLNYKKPTENRVLLINKEDANETTFYIGAPGISRNNPDYIAIDVVNTLFGGRFTSMLNDELRINTGLTYGASSRFATLKNAGSFIISTFTNSKTTAPAIDKAVEVINKLHTKGLDETSLTSAKNYVKGQFPPDYETSGQLAELLSNMFWYNLDRTFIDNFEKNVDNIDLAKANSIIANYFPKDKLQYILVGKASEIKSIAEKLGPVTQININDNPKF